MPLTPDNVLDTWNFAPSLLIPIALTIFIYALGLWHVWHHAGVGHGISKRRSLAFLGAVLSLLMALVSPVDALSETLFSAHMIQHLVLILISAPLLVISDFPVAFLWALPRASAHRIGRGLAQSRPLIRAWRLVSSPVFAWLLFTFTLWVWHAPVFYEAALRDETIHIAEHLGYLLTSMLFWWVLFKPTAAAHQRYGMAVPYLFATSLQSGILGALMTFTTQPWYRYYTDLVAPWGLTPLQDQQLAGLVMWLPGGVVFTLLTIWYFAAWITAMEKHSFQRSNNRPQPAEPTGHTGQHLSDPIQPHHQQK